MPLRLITALVAVLALWPATALAQKATATPGPPNSASDAVKLIYEDYRRDGKIDVCDHERADLQDALDTIEPDFDTDYPDFREAVEAGVTRHDDGRCDADASPTATATPTATASPTATPDDGTLPPPEDDGSTDGGAVPPPDDGTTPPPDDGILPSGDEDPFAATPTPAPETAPPAAQATVAPAASAVPTPATISTKADTSKLLLPGLLVALAIVGALALFFFGRRSPAWREATFRTRATWADFTDWLRLGR